MREDVVIKQYLAALNRALRGYWPNRSRILEEVAAHLDEAAAEARLSGKDEPRASELAVASFGAPKLVARAFAEQRLVGALSASTSALSVSILAALWACVGLERLFPAVPCFHASGGPPTDWLVFTGWSLQALTIPLAAAFLQLRSAARATAAAHVLGALVAAATLGPFAIGFGRLCNSLAEVGAGALPPTIIRMILAIAAMIVVAPVLLAQDALEATLRSPRRRTP